ncbi:MAG: hypothetical protein M0T84_00165 [Betaproteobacteria bacterium]|nr:hypothetical protein [Betaproteobacteria bacterium]
MESKKLLEELNALVNAIEDSFAIIAGTIAEQADPATTLKRILSGTDAMKAMHGQSEWRERLMRSALKIVAMKARPASSNDPELQSLIASVLEAPTSTKH